MIYCLTWVTSLKQRHTLITMDNHFILIYLPLGSKRRPESQWHRCLFLDRLHESKPHSACSSRLTWAHGASVLSWIFSDLSLDVLYSLLRGVFSAALTARHENYDVVQIQFSTAELTKTPKNDGAQCPWEISDQMKRPVQTKLTLKSQSLGGESRPSGCCCG